MVSTLFRNWWLVSLWIGAQSSGIYHIPSREGLRLWSYNHSNAPGQSSPKDVHACLTRNVRATWVIVHCCRDPGPCPLPVHSPICTTVFARTEDEPRVSFWLWASHKTLPWVRGTKIADVILENNFGTVRFDASAVKLSLLGKRIGVWVAA